jgi:hypothetical protein
MNLVRRWLDLALCASACLTSASCADGSGTGRVSDSQHDEGEGELGLETARDLDAMAPSVGQPAMDAGLPRLPSSLDGATASAPTPTGGITCADIIAPTPQAVQLVLQRSCGLSRSCHAGTSPQAGLDLSSLDGIFATAVDRPAMQNPGMMLIAAGSPGESYLLRKIDNTQTAGTAMPPPPSAALCEAKRSAIEEWIRAGAPR